MIDGRCRLLTITLKNTEPWRSCGGDFSHFVAGESLSRQYKPWCHKDNDKNLSHPFCNHRICGLAKRCIMLNYNFWECAGVSGPGGSAGDNDSRAPPLIKSVTSLTIHHASQIIPIETRAVLIYQSPSCVILFRENKLQMLLKRYQSLKFPLLSLKHSALCSPVSKSCFSIKQLFYSFNHWGHFGKMPA